MDDHSSTTPCYILMYFKLYNSLIPILLSLGMPQFDYPLQPLRTSIRKYLIFHDHFSLTTFVFTFKTGLPHPPNALIFGSQQWRPLGGV
jgi:hypothetical protein